MKRVLHYVNLTNGIEAIPTLRDYRFIRLQSTACEQKRWTEVLEGIGPDLLMNLAIGHTCVVYDYSNKRDLSRALWQGIEFVRYCLEVVWFGREAPVHPAMRPYFRQVVDGLPDRTIRMLRYYRQFLSTVYIDLWVRGGRTTHDGDYEWYRQSLREATQA